MNFIKISWRKRGRQNNPKNYDRSIWISTAMRRGEILGLKWDYMKLCVRKPSYFRNRLFLFSLSPFPIAVGQGRWIFSFAEIALCRQFRLWFRLECIRFQLPKTSVESKNAWSKLPQSTGLLQIVSMPGEFSHLPIEFDQPQAHLLRSCRCSRILNKAIFPYFPFFT